MPRSTASIANEWRALGGQRGDKDAFVRMLAGMDQPSTGYDTPALQGTTAKDGPTPRYNTADEARYKAQQNWRGIGEAALGIGDVTNDYVNAGIRDFSWLFGNNEPYQFPRPSEAAANLASEVTNQKQIDPATIRPSVQREAANSRALYGMIPTDVTDAGTAALASATKLGILHGVPNMFLGPAKADAAAGKSADDIWHDWGWEKNKADQWWTEDRGNPAMNPALETSPGMDRSIIHEPPRGTDFPQADQARFGDRDQGNLFHWAEDQYGDYDGSSETTRRRNTIMMTDDIWPQPEKYPIRKQAPMREFVTNPQLYENTPGLEFLGGIPTRVGEVQGAEGYYYPSEKKIEVKGRADQNQMLSTATHELEHAVQDEFGFPSGFNPGRPEASTIGLDMRNRLQSAVDEGNRAFDRRVQAKQAHDDEVYKEGDLTYDPVTGKPNYPPGHLSLTDFNKRWEAENPDEAAILQRAMDAANVNNKYRRDDMLAYGTEAGEVAARNAAVRDLGQQWTPEQLRLLRPEKTEDVNRAFQWWDDGSTKSAAAKDRPRLFYRGTNPGDERRIKTGADDWDSHLFASDNEDAARMYGKNIQRLQAADDAKIAYEGTPEWNKIAGKQKKGENLLDYANRAAGALKAAGYDAAWFERQSDVGTAIFNPAKFSEPPAELPAAAKGDPDDPFFHDVSGIKLDRPIHEMTAEYSPENLPVERKELDPQSMLGGVMLPVPGDRTRAGRQLLGINGEPLDSPVNLEGGPDFMRRGGDAVWAAGQGEATNIANRVRQAEQQSDNGDVYLGYMPMAIPGMDFSDMMTRVIRERMKNAKVSAGDLTAFNDQMRTWRGSLDKKTVQWEYPESQDFPGVEDIPDEWIKDQPGIQRRKLAQLMDKGAWNRRGYPHLGPIRNALTEPGLRDVKSGTMGYSFAKAAPGGGIITNPELPHGTYDTQIGGQYVGGIDTPIPKEVMFSTWYGGESDANKANPSQLDYSFRRKKPIQRLDDQWLENIMRHIEATKRG